jgi:hypothetical protein
VFVLFFSKIFNRRNLVYSSFFFNSFLVKKRLTNLEIKIKKKEFTTKQIVVIYQARKNKTSPKFIINDELIAILLNQKFK